jgi:hemolysin activation/secretion protein
VPLYQWGDSIDVFAGYSDVNSGTISGLFSVSGSGSVFGARYNHNLTRYDTYDHKIVLGYDYRAYRNDVQFGDSSDSLVPDITVRPVSLSYIGEWKTLSQQLSFYATESANIEGGGHGSSADFEASRAGAVAGYMVTRYGADWIRLLDKDWRVHVNFNGQYSAQALVNGEQFGLGGMLGAGAVRGFHERELAGDRGYRLSGEVYTPDFGSKINGNLHARALVFYDYGSLHSNNTQPGEISNTSIASIGAGLRVDVGTNFSLQTDLGRVVNAGGLQDNGDMRGNVSMVLTY